MPHTACFHFSFSLGEGPLLPSQGHHTVHRHYPGRLGMGRSITDNLQGHYSSCQSKDRGFLLPASPVTRRCLLSRATSSLQPSSLACVSHSTPLPSTAGSSFLLPGSNRKLPLRSQGCERLTLRAVSIPRELGQAIREPVQPILVAPPSCPQSYLVAHLQSLSTSTFNRNSSFLLKHTLY